MRITANYNLPMGFELFTGTLFTFNENSNANNSQSSTSFFENTDVGIRWGRWVSENFLAVGLQGYGRFFSGTQIYRNTSGFNRDRSGPFAQAKVDFLISMDFRESLKELPLRSHINLGFRTPNGDLRPTGVANSEDHIELFNLDSFKYQAITAAFGVEAPYRWVNPFIEYGLEWAIGAGDGAKFSNNRHKLGAGAKVTPHESVAILAAVDFGLFGDNKDTTVGIPHNNPWEAYFGLAFTANAKELFQSIGRLKGQVTDAQTGLPLPDVEVTLIGEVTLPRVADLAGAYELRNLDEKDYQVRFQKAGYLPQTLPVKIRGGEATNLDVAMQLPGPKVGNLTAQIVDSTSGEVIPRAFVRISGTDRPLAADENGKLDVQKIETGLKTVRIEAPGYIPAEFPIEVFENETLQQSFSLTREPSKIGTVTGRVTNEEGTGLTAVISSTDGQISPFGTDPLSGSVNQTLPSGTYEFKVVAENYLPETIKVEVPAGDTATIDVKLKKPEVATVVDDRIVLPDAIFFGFNSDKIQQKSFGVLDQIAKILMEQDGKFKVLRVEGHTDDVGSEEYNQKLSERRANSVKRYLMNKGISPAKIEAVGLGETKPIATNLSDEGRSENRRVEFHLVRE